MSSSVKAALIANTLVATAKGIGALATGSSSMMAETIHSFTDCGNQLLLLFGQKQSNKNVSRDHPFGHGKESYFWSFLVAVLLFTLGGAFSIYEGIHKISDPEPIKNAGWAFGILAISFLLEGKALSVCLKEIHQKYPGKSLVWFFKETRNTDLLVVLGEDSAALLGLSSAAFFLALSVITGNPMWDAVGSIAVGILLCVVAAGLFVETKALLIGQSVDPDTRKELFQFLAKREEIEHTYECLTLQMGKEAILLIRARMVEKECAQTLLTDINNVEDAIKAQFPEFEWIWFEPDNKLDGN